MSLSLSLSSKDDNIFSLDEEVGRRMGKRGAENQLTKDNAHDEEDEETSVVKCIQPCLVDIIIFIHVQTGEFNKATPEQIAARK
jgi:hypothetical protein